MNIIYLKELTTTYSYLEKLYGKSKGGKQLGKNIVKLPNNLHQTAEKSEELAKNLHQIAENSEELPKNLQQIAENSVKLPKNLHQTAENSEELIEENLETVENSEELIEENLETAEKKVWPFTNSQQKNEEKKILPARKVLKEEIAKRKDEINSSGLKRNEILSKENLEKLISEGLGYTEIGRRVGRMPATVKAYCEKYNLEIMRNVRKTIPDSLKKYLDDQESKKQLFLENKKEVKKLLSTMDKEWINNTKLCIYGVFKKDDLECVYIGSTEDFTKRILMHKKGYEGGDNRKLYTLMKENGGFDNHIYIPLEKPENEIGLSVRESLWWETLKPLGNSVNPYFTT